MSKYSDIAFLCASFSVSRTADRKSVLEALGWERQVFDEVCVNEHKAYFYPEFVDFSSGHSKEGEGVHRYVKKVGRRMESLSCTDESNVNMQSDSVAGPITEVVSVTLYDMPYGMMLYAIRVDQKSDSLNDFTLNLSRLRNVMRCDNAWMAELEECALAPLREVAQALGDGTCIVENGNKFKVFQIVVSEHKPDDDAESGDTLFELGTLGKIGGCSAQSPDSPSRAYIEHLLKDNTLSFFNNWNALALFDTFTIRGYAVHPWVMSTWIDNYFSMIYMHSLFCKFYLFRLNARFRAMPEHGDKLEEEYNDFQRRYVFHRISYNFLPYEIDAAIDRALEIEKEMKMLKSYIKTYNEERSRMSTGRFDRILTFLAVLTVASTLWDFSSMINAMYPLDRYAGTLEAGFRSVVSLAILVILITVIMILRRRK